MNELDTLANIDLKTRMPKEEHHSLNLIRLGTCGALQPDIEVGDSYVATRYAIGLDGLIYFYEKNKEVNEISMRDAFIKQMDYPKDLPLPYVVEGSRLLPRRNRHCSRILRTPRPHAQNALGLS